jgi:hypothetical protein
MPAHPTRWCGASDLTNTRQRRGEGDDSPFTGMALGEGGGESMAWERRVTSTGSDRTWRRKGRLKEKNQEGKNQKRGGEDPNS